jgi:hypothetical protein
MNVIFHGVYQVKFYFRLCLYKRKKSIIIKNVHLTLIFPTYDTQLFSTIILYITKAILKLKKELS